jgi:hypothetical protein
VQNVNEHKQVGLPGLNCVALHEETHDRQVDNEENGVPG